MEETTEPYWRCQRWPGRVLLPSVARFRRSWMSVLTSIFPVQRKRKNMNPLELICRRLSAKRTRLQQRRRVDVEGQREQQTVKTLLLHFRGICQASIGCSPFKTSMVNGAAIIWSSATLPAPLRTKLLRCHRHLEAITIYSYTHTYSRICGRISGFGICPKDLLSHWQQLWLLRQPQKL